MKNKDSVSGLAPVNQLFKLPGLWSPGDQDAEATSVAYQLHDLGEHFAFLCLVFFICKM